MFSVWTCPPICLPAVDDVFVGFQCQPQGTSFSAFSSSWRTRSSRQSTRGAIPGPFTSCRVKSRPPLKRSDWQVRDKSLWKWECSHWFSKILRWGVLNSCRSRSTEQLQVPVLFFPSQTSGSVNGNVLVDGKTIDFTQLESCLSLWWIVICEKTKSRSFHFLCMEELQDSTLTILICDAWIMTDCTHVTSAVMPAVCNRFTSFQGIKTTWLIGSPCYPFPLNTIQYNIILLPSVNTLIAWGMFCGAKYAHHTFTPIIKHLITTTANKHPGKKSFLSLSPIPPHLPPTPAPIRPHLTS